MYVPQIRSIGQHPNPRRSVRPVPQHHQREDLCVHVALVRPPLFHHSHVPPLQGRRAPRTWHLILNCIPYSKISWGGVFYL